MSYFNCLQETITTNVFITYSSEGLASIVSFSKIFARDNIIRYDLNVNRKLLITKSSETLFL